MNKFKTTYLTLNCYDKLFWGHEFSILRYYLANVLSTMNLINEIQPYFYIMPSMCGRPTQKLCGRYDRILNK